jgi:hypothetical protein
MNAVRRFHPIALVLFPWCTLGGSDLFLSSIAVDHPV